MVKVTFVKGNVFVVWDMLDDRVLMLFGSKGIITS